MTAADSVADAVATPDRQQPHAALGLTDAEYASIVSQLGRRPTESELAVYSVMWSEHCSYKSSRRYLRQFGEKAPPSAALLAGIGQNAGVVDIGQGYAVTFKIESHNHPSYVEPFQGAATGVGGIVRDILAMGARPVAVLDSLRFGPADAPDTRRVLPGVVAGISFYGVLWLEGSNDVLADHFNVPLYTITEIARVAVFVVPVLAYIITKRICLGLQRMDLHLLEHGVETGIIRQLPSGGFVEETRPLDEEMRAKIARPEPLALPPGEIAVDADVPSPGMRGNLGRAKARMNKIVNESVPMNGHGANGHGPDGHGPNGHGASADEGHAIVAASSEESTEADDQS